MSRSRRVIWVFLLLLVMLVFGMLMVLAKYSVSESTKYLRPDLRADVTKVRERLGSSEWMVVDARTEREYGSGHLEGAVNLPWTRFLESDGSVAVTRLAEILGEAGLKPSDGIVVMGGENAGPAALVYMVLDSVGHANSQVLVEPLRELRSSGSAIVSGLPARGPAGSYVASVDRRSRFVNTDWMVTHLHDKDLVILDVRTVRQTEPAPGIPGARQLMLEGSLGERAGTRIFLDVFAAKVRAAEIGLKSQIVVYGQSALDGAQVCFVLDMMGHQDVRLYDGGWTAWSADPSRATDVLMSGPKGPGGDRRP